MMDNAEISGIDGAGNSGATIEIKVKTMDSQNHTLRVDKQVSVPTLKEQVASVTGVVKEHQRLICRGRVLKDDQLLSAYHVEDGHTLHLVVREPPSSTMENLPNDSVDRPDQLEILRLVELDYFAMPSGGRSEYFQVAPGVLVETLQMQGQGERSLPDIGRILSAVLGSIGITGPGSFGEGTGLREIGLEGLESMPVRGDAADTNQPQPEQPASRNRSDRLRSRSAFGVGAAFPFGAGQAPVIPDALSTLSQYLSNMQREFSGNGETDAWPPAVDTEQTEAGSVRSGNSHGLPTPASLAELLFSTRELLHQQSGECLVQLARQLEGQASVTDPEARLSTQSSAWRTGVLFQNMGAYLLELGRTIMTVRLGRSPAEAIVNAGPAVFISSTGPNPLMVQPLPFQPGATFGSTPTPAGTSAAGPSLSNGLGSGLLPRRIDIHIRRGSLARQPEADGTQQPSGQQDPSAVINSETVINEPTSATSTNPSVPGGPSVRVMPLRTMVAAIPAIPDLNRVPSDVSASMSGLQFPFVGRYMPSQNTSNRAGSQLPSENQPSGLRTEQNVVPEVTAQQQNVENPPRNGQGDRPPSRTIDISIFSSGGPQGDQSPDGQPPDSVLQFLRGLFPGGEVHVESSQGAASVSFPERANATGVGTPVPEAESRPTEDGIFLSGLLQQIMPFISHLPGTDQSGAAFSRGAGPSSSTTVEDSEAGTSGRHTDTKLDEPNSKRQKME